MSTNSDVSTAILGAYRAQFAMAASSAQKWRPTEGTYNVIIRDVKVGQSRFYLAKKSDVKEGDKAPYVDGWGVTFTYEIIPDGTSTDVDPDHPRVFDGATSVLPNDPKACPESRKVSYDIAISTIKTKIETVLGRPCTDIVVDLPATMATVAKQFVPGSNPIPFRLQVTYDQGTFIKDRLLQRI